MEITSKESIVTEIKNATAACVAFFDSIPADEFFTRRSEAWSASDNVDHLVRAITPVTRALKLPKLALQTMFGKVDRPLRSYAELCKAYEDVLATGVGASGAFLPDQQTPIDTAKQKAALLDQLSKTGHVLAATLDEKWQDAALDQAQLPHPLLGKLTLREMMFFSIYHALRHARVEGD